MAQQKKTPEHTHSRCESDAFRIRVSGFGIVNCETFRDFWL